MTFPESHRRFQNGSEVFIFDSSGWLCLDPINDTCNKSLVICAILKIRFFFIFLEFTGRLKKFLPNLRAEIS